MKLAIITVPYINNDFIAKLAEDTYKTFDYKDALKIAVVNHCRKSDREMLKKYNDIVVDNTENCLASAWNYGIKTAQEMGCTHFLITNLDIRLQKGAISRLFKFAGKHPEMLVWGGFAVNTVMQYRLFEPQDTFALLKQHDQAFSCFMISNKTIETVGWFDEIFKPCYYEDSDYIYRLELLKKPAVVYHGAIFFHYVQATAKNDPVFQKTYNQNFIANTKRYTKKWGGMPDGETYKSAYNK